MKAYKTELAPNNKQKAFFYGCAGAKRYVFNWGLATWKEWYEGGERKPSRFGLCKHFNSIKDELCPWIRQYPYAVTESAFENLGRAFDGFFRRVKRGETPGYPKFKKRGRKDSFALRNVGVFVDGVRLTGIGRVRLKERAYIPADAVYGVYAAISRSADRWFISVLVKEEIEPGYPVGEPIGVDFGIKEIATCSDGTVFENPRILKSAEKKLASLQRELARRKQGGENWKKTRKKVQRQYAKVARTRRHVQHQVSHYVTAQGARAIVLEDLNVSGMVKNHCLAKAINDVGFYELRRQVEYKAEWAGAEVVFADRWYASSKTCSGCGCVNKDLTLSDRIYVCPECGFEIDRDLNAALNLARLA